MARESPLLTRWLMRARAGLRARAAKLSLSGRGKAGRRSIRALPLRASSLCWRLGRVDSLLRPSQLQTSRCSSGSQPPCTCLSSISEDMRKLESTPSWTKQTWYTAASSASPSCFCMKPRTFHRFGGRIYVPCHPAPPLLSCCHPKSWTSFWHRYSHVPVGQVLHPPVIQHPHLLASFRSDRYLYQHSHDFLHQPNAHECSTDSIIDFTGAFPCHPASFPAANGPYSCTTFGDKRSRRSRCTGPSPATSLPAKAHRNRMLGASSSCRRTITRCQSVGGRLASSAHARFRLQVQNLCLGG